MLWMHLDPFNCLVQVPYIIIFWDEQFMLYLANFDSLLWILNCKHILSAYQLLESKWNQNGIKK